MPSQMQLAGAQPQKGPKYAPLFVDRAFTGLYTQRNPLHDPSSVIEAKFYGGRPDALLSGSNVELTNELTLKRRPGLTPFSPAIYPTAPLCAYSFERDNGTIQVIIDCGPTGSLALSAVDVISGVAYYHFSISQSTAADNAFFGWVFEVSGFDDANNNGTFVCVGCESSYLILDNVLAVTDVHPGTAISTGAVYYDYQVNESQLDTFQRANENPLSDGGDWTQAFGTQPLQIVSNLAEPTALNTACSMIFIGSALPNDQYSEGVITTLAGVTPSLFLIVRASLTSQTWYQVNITGPTGTAQTQTLYAISQGVTTPIGDFTATTQVNDLWRLAVQGTTLYVFQNSTLLLTVTDTTISSGYAGFGLYNATAVTDSQISSWGAGTSQNLSTTNSDELLFGKNPGAGQTFFVAVAGILYTGDGVDTRKYVPDVTNLNPDAAMGASGQVWNWGGAAPAAQPNVTTVESGSAAVTWVANTVFSTMGLLLDSVGHVEFLTSVNAIGTNTTQFGTTGSGQPAWNQNTGSITTDNTCNWTNWGPISLWTAGTTYTYEQPIFDPTTGWIFQSSGGKSGNARPHFNPTINTHTADANGMIWQAVGLAAVWKPNFTYHAWWEHNICIVCEPVIPTQALLTAGTQTVYLQSNNDQTTGSQDDPGISGSGYTPAWPGQIGGTTIDNALTWIDLGTATWAANTPYSAWTQGSSTFSVVEDPYGDFQVCVVSGQSGSSAPATQWQVAHVYTGAHTIAVRYGAGLFMLFTTTSGGTSGSSTAANPSGQPVWNFTATHTTTDNTVTWTCTGTTTTSAWGNSYGSNTSDGSVTWTNVGPIITWATNTSWYLPKAGFAPPSSSQPYGGAEVIGNGSVQAVIATGKSGSNQPNWAETSQVYTLTGVAYTSGQSATYSGTITGGGSNAYAGYLFNIAGFVTNPSNNGGPFLCYASTGSTLVLVNPNAVTESHSATATAVPIGSETTDNGITWYTDATESVNSLAWTSGYVYAYSYYARLASDGYNTSVAQGGFGPPPGVASVLGTPTGSEAGTMTTASPVFTITGSNAGAVNTITGLGPTDPQFDTIVIWRSADGGGAANMFWLTEFNAPKPIQGTAQTWSFVDYLPDLPTNVFPGLNELISAPINDQNNPPPSNFLPMVYNFIRIWGASGQTMFNSGGPDIEAGQGNPNEAFNPGDNYPFLANVTNARKCSQGIVVFLTDSIQIIAGGPATSSFYTVEISDNIGLSSPNAIDQYGGEIYFFAADSEGKMISVNLQLSNFGFPIGDKFAAFNAADVYLTVQQANVDNCIFVTDGSTGWYRCNPYQVPGGYSGPGPVWSPFANITGGAQMVQSIEVTPGIKKVLVGPTPATTAANGGAQILERNLSVYTDGGVMYDSFFVLGSVMLCNPGQLCLLKFLEMDFSGVNYQPTISYLLNEISGAFTQFTLAPQFDPPSLYGSTLSPTSYSPNRYFFSGTGSLARARHMQIMVDFGITPNPDELFNLTIFGRIFVET
jgi:hypothetical protein